MPDIFVANEQENKKENSQEVDKKPFKEQKGTARHNLSGHSHNPFSAFSYYPDRANFVTQDPDEKIVLLLRKHPISNLRWIFIAALLIIAPFFLTAFPIIDFLPVRFQTITILFWYLLVVTFIFEQFLNWFFNVYIVTDERIIDVDFVNLVYREISDANIDQIQDVTAQMGGAIRTVVNYGDVIIQTAAEVPKIELEEVPYPDRVSRILRDLRIEEEQENLEGRVR